MQLQMSRSQKKGLFKTAYVLNAHVIFTPEERTLLKQHKLEDFELFNAEEEWGPPYIHRVTAAGYITNGHDFKCDTIDQLAILENRLQENCKLLSRQLKSLDGAFDGGPRTINFDED